MVYLLLYIYETIEQVMLTAAFPYARSSLIDIIWDRACEGGIQWFLHIYKYAVAIAC